MCVCVCVCVLVGWLCLTSHRQQGHLLSLDVKLDKYTVPTGN